LADLLRRADRQLLAGHRLDPVGLGLAALERAKTGRGHTVSDSGLTGRLASKIRIVRPNGAQCVAIISNANQLEIVEIASLRVISASNLPVSRNNKISAITKGEFIMNVWLTGSVRCAAT
jgi:hypothetical protein